MWDNVTVKVNSTDSIFCLLTLLIKYQANFKSKKIVYWI